MILNIELNIPKELARAMATSLGMHTEELSEEIDGEEVIIRERATDLEVEIFLEGAMLKSIQETTSKIRAESIRHKSAEALKELLYKDEEAIGQILVGKK